MTRIIVCSLALIAVIAATNYGLKAGFDQFGFGTGMAICIGFAALCVIGAFAYDHFAQRRGPQSRR